MYFAASFTNFLNNQLKLGGGGAKPFSGGGKMPPLNRLKLPEYFPRETEVEQEYICVT